MDGVMSDDTSPDHHVLLQTTTMPGLRASCQKCAKTTSTPINFLLTCSSCSSSWHHRELIHSTLSFVFLILFSQGCHSPLVSDHELLARIKATNAQDSLNDIAAWKCAACIAPPIPAIIDLTASSDEEPLTAALPQTEPANNLAPTPAPSNNLATSWIRQRHPDVWLKPRKVPRSRKPATPTKSPNRDSFCFSALQWLQERALSDPNHF